MLRALLLVAREIALAHDQWLAQFARRRPLAAENAALRETLERQRAQIELLRARLLRLHPRRRPRYCAWERLTVLWHRSRYRYRHLSSPSTDGQRAIQRFESAVAGLSIVGGSS